MDTLTGVIRFLKKEQARLTKELRGVGAALAAFSESYRKEIEEIVGISAGADRGCAERALGQGSRKIETATERSSYPC